MAKSIDLPEIQKGDDDDARLKPIFINQFGALVRKNAVYQWRQYKTNCCQISFPLMMIVLLFLLQLLVDSILKDLLGDSIKEVVTYPTEPYALYETNIELGADNSEACPDEFDSNPVFQSRVFYYAGEEYGLIDNLYLNETNAVYTKQGRTFPDRGNYQSFCRTKLFFTFANWSSLEEDELASYFYDLYGGETNVLGGYWFHDVNNTIEDPVLDVTVLYNDTLSLGDDLPLFVDSITDGFLRMLLPNVRLVLDGIKKMPTEEKENTFDLISLLGPFLYTYVFQLTFPVILGNLVYEKETKLREIMKMMGLKMKTFWLVTYLFSYVLYLICFLLVWAAAAILSFRFYTINAPGIIFVFFFLWGHVLVANAFFFSVFFQSSQTATVVGYIWVFATGLLSGQVISTYLDNSETDGGSKFGISVIPQLALFRGLYNLRDGVAFDGPGLSWEKPREIGEVMGFFVVQWVILMTLAIYLEATLKTGYGVKKHPLFFLQKSFWRGEAQVHHELSKKQEGEPEDVAQMRQTLIDESVDYFLRVEDLNKVYPGENGLPDKIAVKKLALGVKFGECLGFLGPNGAGKSTTINVLCGLYRPTAGTAFVKGFDIRYNIDEIHTMMGVCPQDNVLWDDLTGPEHLRFYGRLKNVKGPQLEEEIMELLKAVNLHEETKKRARQYSGGMKRRLSVACSLIGHPKVVLLDEPSTGLDPASRRQLWALINERKKTCTMLLTTHAMEEADVLCDKIGIFSAGELKCIGSSSELKGRYGKGYKVTLHVEQGREQEAIKFMEGLTEGADVLNSLAGTINFEVPKKSVQLSRVFVELESKKEGLGIIDWGISNTTLEEVFLKIANQMEEEIRSNKKKSRSKKGKGKDKDTELDVMNQV